MKIKMCKRIITFVLSCCLVAGCILNVPGFTVNAATTDWIDCDTNDTTQTLRYNGTALEANQYVKQIKLTFGASSIAGSKNKFIRLMYHCDEAGNWSTVEYRAASDGSLYAGLVQVGSDGTAVTDSSGDISATKTVGRTALQHANYAKTQIATNDLNADIGHSVVMTYETDKTVRFQFYSSAETTDETTLIHDAVLTSETKSFWSNDVVFQLYTYNGANVDVSNIELIKDTITIDQTTYWKDCDEDATKETLKYEGPALESDEYVKQIKLTFGASTLSTNSRIRLMYHCDETGKWSTVEYRDTSDGYLHAALVQVGPNGTVAKDISQDISVKLNKGTKSPTHQESANTTITDTSLNADTGHSVVITYETDNTVRFRFYNEAETIDETTLICDFVLTSKTKSFWSNNVVFQLQSLIGNNVNVSNIEVISMKEKLIFTGNMTYQTENALSQAPKTLSAWIQLNEDFSDRGGIILGNYKDGTTPSVGFEISKDGQPRFYYMNDNKYVLDIKFDGDVRADEWVHLAFVVDGQNVTCYVNGEACTASSTSNSHQISVDWDLITNPYCLGGDLRDKNEQYFKGQMQHVDLYSEVLSAEEIANIYNKTSAVTGFASYNLENQRIKDDIVNQLSDDGTDNFVAWPRYFDAHEVNDYAYSFAVIGDTQIVAEYDVAAKTEHLNGIYDWILNNQESKNIQYVFGLGDITDNNSEAEWNVAQTAIERLNGKIPYSLVRGNHDMVGHNNVSIDYFTEKLGTEAYKNQFDEFYSDTDTWNAWRTFTVGKVNYLLLSLDYGANDEVLTWAGEVISAHPEHNVIITTHAYLYRDGTTLDDGDECPPSKTSGYSGLNDGDDIWNELISQHDNIVLVMSGHDPCEDIVVTQTPGKNGTKVTQMLIDPQGVDVDESVTGMVTMLYFSEDGSHVQVEHYSTVREKFFKRNNQFEFDIATVDGELDFETASMDVSDSLAMNYTISVGESLLASDDTVNVVIDGPGEEANYTLGSEDRSEDGTYTFAYTDIRAHELTDTITVTVTAGNVTKSYKYSVLEYCKDVLELTDEALKEQKYDTDDISALRDLVIDLVQYGAALVEYRGGNGEQYTNAISEYAIWDLNDKVIALGELKDAENSGYVSTMLEGNNTDADYKWKGIGLTLKDKVNIRVTVEAENTDGLAVAVFVGDAEEPKETIAAEAFVEKSENQYYVYFDKLMAYQYGEKVTFKFLVDGVVANECATVTYSVNTYLYNTYNSASTNDELKELLPYINEYGWAAVSYYKASQTPVEEQ